MRDWLFGFAAVLLLSVNGLGCGEPEDAEEGMIGTVGQPIFMPTRIAPRPRIADWSLRNLTPARLLGADKRQVAGCDS
jgi:hypothetical protein